MLGGKCEHSRQENSCIKCLTYLSFLQNNSFNDDVSSNDKVEVFPIMAAVPKLSNSVAYYASHRLCSNVQFYAIETIMQSIKTDPSMVYMAPDHKQKVFHMSYCGIQVYYFGKKGMIILGMMEA